MKEKTSITLSSDVLAKVDRLAGSKHSRSSFIESVLRKYLLERAHAAVQARDLERINECGRSAQCSKLQDAIDYQVPEND